MIDIGIEKPKPLIIGSCLDQIREFDRHGRFLGSYFLPKKFNKVVDGGNIHLASGLISSGSPIEFHALGNGDANWDIGGIPEVPNGATALVAETFRKVPNIKTFIDEVTGTADSGTATTLVDSALASFSDGAFNFLVLEITAGTNAGESRLINGFVQAGTLITVASPFSNPIDSSSEYEINLPTVTRTGKVQVQTTFTQSEANGVHREQAIFGLGASATLGSGLMLNTLRVKVTKNSNQELIRRIRFDVVIDQT